MSAPEITTVHDRTPSDEKDVKQTQATDVGDVESVIDKDTAPAFYSKVSVYLMMLFSGLALGSDGYNAAIMSNLNLLLTVIYPDALSSDMKARLSNAFLIGMIVGMVGFGVVVDQLGRNTGAVLTTLILLLGIALSAGGEYPVAGKLPMNQATSGSDEDFCLR